MVRGEILPAYVERTREGGRVDIALRAFGGKAKAQDLGQSILQALQRVDGGGINNVSNGAIPVGDKSSPEEINAVFPGTSKSAFKKAVAMLYKEGKVQPGPYSIRLM
ncbi:MAG: hypothetical protein COW42_15900 [Deltaproteobacteria bacterium CG17_big_fil_post_rev_8_21_14_2_50_63_7]|nr:MAG: hypothetical protein COW42_15900 [Deltaproteobacteria bacterium CG17_big_fil_post_rev_8_21_14_2_50_63_7]